MTEEKEENTEIVEESEDLGEIEEVIVPFKDQIAKWQGADDLRRLLKTSGSTIGYFHVEKKLLQGKYRIEGRKSDRKGSLDYRAIDVTLEEDLNE